MRRSTTIATSLLTAMTLSACTPTGTGLTEASPEMNEMPQEKPMEHHDCHHGAQHDAAHKDAHCH